MSIRFDTAGEDYHITTGLPGNSIPTTVMMWVFLQVDTNTYQTIFNDNDTNYFLGCAPDGQTLIFYDGTDRTTNQVLALGAWNHICLASLGTSRLVYLNGNLVLNYTSGSSSDAPTSYYFGSTSGGSFSYNGRLAAVKLWTANLSNAEIKREMSQQMPIRKSNLYGFWPMIQLDVGGVDFSNYGHTLSASGTLSTEDNPPVPWISLKNTYKICYY